MSTVVSRWTSKLKDSEQLLDRAERSVKWWARRAASAHGRQMLAEAVARRTLAQSQVAEARKVLARHHEVHSISAEGLAFIAGFEGFRSKPYKPTPNDVWTIGYGHTAGVTPNTPPWTRAHALAVFKTEVDERYLKPVLAAIKAAGLTAEQHMVDALTSLAYNLGPGVLQAGHTMGDALRSHSRDRIAAAFLVYDKQATPHGPVVLGGLARRRAAERAMYLKGAA